MFFFKTVDSIIADIQDKITRLSELVVRHNDMAEEALQDHQHHSHQRDKAWRIKDKLEKLIE